MRRRRGSRRIRTVNELEKKEIETEKEKMKEKEKTAVTTLV